MTGPAVLAVLMRGWGRGARKGSSLAGQEPMLSLSSTSRIKEPLKDLWSICHIAILVGNGIWPQFDGPFGP